MLKLLIVDDSNVIRTRITRIVEKKKNLQIEVVGVATNGVDALNIASQKKIDVITMDLTMPKMDGLETISRVLNIHPRARILVVSALDDKSTAIAALSLGACGFLGKPFTDEELLLSLLEAAEVH